MSRTRGLIAISITVIAWAGFALSARLISVSSMSPVEVAVLRFVTASVLLIPWWRSTWREVRGIGLRDASLMAVCGGLPFFLLTALGASKSSAAHVSIINAGAAPLLVALFVFLIFRRYPQRFIMLCLAVIAVGIVCLALGTSHAGAGVIILLGSAALWAMYTIVQDRVRLSAASSIVLIAVPSALASVVFAWPKLPSLLSVPARDILFFILAQGIGSAVVSIACYGIAVNALGADIAALAGALTPILVALISVFVLGDLLSPLAWIGLGLVVFGVATSIVVRNVTAV